MNLSAIKTELHKMDTSLKDDDSAFRTGIVMLSALQVGPSNEALRQFTGYPRAFVRETTERLRQGGVFHGGKVRCEWFEENGSVSFWLDVGVGLGWFEKTES